VAVVYVSTDLNVPARPVVASGLLVPRIGQV